MEGDKEILEHNGNLDIYDVKVVFPKVTVTIYIHLMK